MKSKILENFERDHPVLSLVTAFVVAVFVYVILSALLTAITYALTSLVQWDIYLHYAWVWRMIFLIWLGIIILADLED